MNKNPFYVGVGYYVFWFMYVVSKVGEMTDGPHLIVWWDVVWIPFVSAGFPFLLGMSVFKSTKEESDQKTQDEDAKL